MNQRKLRSNILFHACQKEQDNPLWPGETLAMIESCGAGTLRIQRLDFDPYIGFAVIGD